MKLVVGTETGLVKLVTEAGQSKTIYGVESRKNAVKHVQFGRNSGELLITRSHCVTIYSLARETADKEIPCKSVEIAGASFVSESLVLIVLGDGVCHLHDVSDSTTSSFKVSGPVTAFASHSCLFAIGGKNNNVSVHDALTQKCVWKAKGLPHDWLEMAVPVWVTSISFNESHFTYDPSRKNGCPLSARLAVTTRYHQLQIYETNIKRRPVHHIDVGEDPMFCSLQAHSLNVVFAGAAKGQTFAYDAVTGQSMGILKPSCAGSVRCIAKHPTEPFVATVSLDRYLRIYTEVSRRQQHKHYLKQRLTAVMFLEDLPEKSESDGEEEDEDEDWDELPVVGDDEPEQVESKKRKRK